MSNLLVETDPEKRFALIEERKNLLEFVESKGYKAGIKIVEQTYTNAIEVILDSVPDAESMRNQAIGEARCARDFKALFTNRLVQLNEAIGELTEDEK